MRALLAGSGFALLILGSVLMLYLWPFIGFETKDTFTMEEVEGGERVSYVGEISHLDKHAGIYLLELDGGVLEVYTDDKNLKVDDRVFVTVQFSKNATNWENNTYTVQKVPTLGGLVGALLSIIGSGITLAGVFLRKTDLEDSVSFSVGPPLQSTSPDGVLPPGQATKSKIEHVTCPKCQNTFGVQIQQKPMTITCPKCGLEGVLR